METAGTARRLRVWIALALTAVALVLGTVNLVLAVRLRPQAREATEISQHYAAAVRLLSTMQTRVADVAQAVATTHVRSHPTPVSVARARVEIGALLDALAGDARRFAPYAAHADEAPRWQAIARERLPALRDRCFAALDGWAADRDAHADAAAACLEEAHRTNGALDALIFLNATSAVDAANRIDGALRRFLGWSVGLGLLGAGAAWFLFRVGAGALDRYERASSLRLADLEAFASRVAHDLRTPLQGIKLALVLAERSAPQLEATCARGRRSAERLQGLIEDLLEFSRAGAAPEHGASAPVAQILEEVREDVEEAAREARATLEVRCEGAPVAATTRGALRAITANLVENALKYLGDREPRRVEIEARAGDGVVRIQVRDTGPGMTGDVLARVFDPFFRAAAQPSGTGIGLATVKRLVSAYRGTVEAASEPGRGTTFTVVLPRARG